MKYRLILALALLFCAAPAAQAKTNAPKGKILFVLTSHDRLGSTDIPTGFYLSEVTHPYEVLHNAGYEIEFVSPKGGAAPVDGKNLDDEVNKAFWENPQTRKLIETTRKASEVDPREYDAIFFAGGRGTMWDFPESTVLQDAARTIYEGGGVVGAVCHGPAALVNLKLSNGEHLVEGRKVNAFTNEEERASFKGMFEEDEFASEAEREAKFRDVTWFLLEDKLKALGAKWEESEKWQSHVAVDGRLITGQNPASAHGVGEAMVKALEEIKQQGKGQN